MRVAVITTSRADYGIYHSLLRELAADPAIVYGMVVSGTHLSEDHGRTIAAIEADGHPIWGKVESVPETDDAAAIAAVTGTALTGFAVVWARLAAETDVIVALGDRYEMFAAVAATVPFNLPVAHLHGGETTLGAIDDKCRHAITAMSAFHFTATEAYAGRVAAIIGSREYVAAVGAPSLDGLDDLNLPDIPALHERFGIDFSRPTILVTVHPETVNTAANEHLAREMTAAFDVLSREFQVVITLPNADTMGSVLRTAFQELVQGNDRVIALESFGKAGYFAAMKYANFLIGNTSSGLLEAPSFGKYVINVGARQAGRARSANVLDTPIDRAAVLGRVAELKRRGMDYRGDNVYLRDGRAAKAIVERLRAWIDAE